ncbi:hypothetical protein HDU82_006418 [Entophlyctis luteolus]|nr:hypothetical protein HDU82_006418 [Entophlyctis luteolus]
MENITFCDVDAEDLSYVDPNFVKLFKISQLIIEYLVYTQDVLAEAQLQLSNDLEDATEKLEILNDQFDKQAVKKENRILKKSLYAYQVMMRIPESTFESGGNMMEPAGYHKCGFCAKIFKTVGFLESHIFRRHSHQAASSSQFPSSNSNEFNVANRQMFPHTNQNPAFPPSSAEIQKDPKALAALDELTETVEALKSKMKISEMQLKREMEERLQTELIERQKILNEKYEQDRLRNEKEIQSLKSSIHQQLSDERAAFEEEKAALQKIIAENKSQARRSRLGALEDDDDLAPDQDTPPPDSTFHALAEELARKQTQAIADVASKFEHQIETLNQLLKSKSDSGNKELEVRLEKATKQIAVLHDALKEEHKLNETRDEELRSFVSKSQQQQKTTPISVSTLPIAPNPSANMPIISPSESAMVSLKAEHNSGQHHTSSSPILEGLAHAAINYITHKDATIGSFVADAVAEVAHSYFGDDSNDQEKAEKSADTHKSLTAAVQGSENSPLGSSDDLPLSLMKKQDTPVGENRSKEIVLKSIKPNFQAKTSLGWNQVFVTLEAHKYTPLKDCPWIRTSAPQSIDSIVAMQRTVLKEVDETLKDFKIDEQTVMTDMADHPRVSEWLKEQFRGFQESVILAKDKDVPLYKEMRLYVDNKVTEVAKQNFKFKPKFPFNVTKDSMPTKEGSATVLSFGQPPPLPKKAQAPKSILKSEQSVLLENTHNTVEMISEAPARKNSWAHTVAANLAVAFKRTGSLDIRTEKSLRAKPENDKGNIDNHSDESSSSDETSSGSSEKNMSTQNSGSPAHSELNFVMNTALRNQENHLDMVVTESCDESSSPRHFPDTVRQTTAEKSSMRASSELLNILGPTPNLLVIPKKSDDSFDVSELSDANISVETDSPQHQAASFGSIARKSTGEIAASALKPVSRTNSTKKSTQSVNFKVENFNIHRAEPRVLPVKQMQTLGTESDISEISQILNDGNYGKVAEKSDIKPGLIGLYYVTHLEQVPVSGRTRFMDMSKFEEDYMAKQAYEGIMHEFGHQIVPSSHPAAKFVNRVAWNLIKVAGMSDVEWEVHLIDNPQSNAFVIPGGKIFVFTGILPVVQNEDGLAAVLGHEIAHQLARHSAEKMSTMKILLLGRMLLAVVFDIGVLGRVLADVGLLKPFSRLCETEADYIGLQLMAQACYDPNAAVDMWKRMKAMDGGHNHPQYLSTHPSHENRISKITEWLPEANRVRENADCKDLAPLWSLFSRTVMGGRAGGGNFSF